MAKAGKPQQQATAAEIGLGDHHVCPAGGTVSAELPTTAAPPASSQTAAWKRNWATACPLWDSAFAFSENVRDCRIGWKFSPASQGNTTAPHKLELDATRSESTGGDIPAEHGVMLRSTLL
ncbi:MAG: hypothetical protein TE42_04915 [Candidatus Synechococcus spongiarum SP3]|uniref:Uncharacterized protein n=1 Tax=Candidatus Synechococcus spongiarum SP3 TaxID=1604020 RepID=A0A0G2HL71_9SYNE|nr:MAG: hypothetical protein TE42_04915 [Candidatus Synechococcus spongiarum SP3]